MVGALEGEQDDVAHHLGAGQPEALHLGGVANNLRPEPSATGWTMSSQLVDEVVLDQRVHELA
jgi:hypothetical protein